MFYCVSAGPIRWSTYGLFASTGRIIFINASNYLIKQERLLATSCRTETFNYLLLLKGPAVSAYIAYVIPTYMCAFPSTFYQRYLFTSTLRTRVFCTVLVSVAGQV